MESLFFLVPIALIFVAIAIKVLFWAIKSGQYDNLDTEAHRILFDEDESEAPKSKTKEQAEVKAVDEAAKKPAHNSEQDPPRRD